MKENNLINLSLIYYDTQKEKYKKYYKKNITLYLESGNKNLNLPIFNLKKNDNILIEGNFNIIGIFEKDTNKFIWAWYKIVKNNNNKIVKNNTFFVRQIINYILDYDIDENNLNEEILFYNQLKKLFLNPELSIEYQIELEIILAITLFITKSDMIYKIYNKNNNTDQFFILKNMKINK
jgi:hypothetical protein